MTSSRGFRDPSLRCIVLALAGALVLLVPVGEAVGASRDVLATARSPMLVLGGQTHLPAGTSGRIAVVSETYTGMSAAGPNGASVIGDQGQVLLVLRNNTAKTVYDVRVTARVVAPNGSVLASKDDLGAQPIGIPPRGLAIDIIGFSAYPVTAYPVGSKFQFVMTSDARPSAGYVDVLVKSAKLGLAGGTVSGVAENPSKNTIYGPFEVLAACLNPQSSVFSFAVAKIQNYDSAAPGQQLPFSAEFDYRGGIPTEGTAGVCRHTLVSVVGSS